MVGVGNVIFDKYMQVRRNSKLLDHWAPVASVMGVRFVQARATAHKRKGESIDLVSAYTQVVLGGDIPMYMMISKEVV